MSSKRRAYHNIGVVEAFRHEFLKTAERKSKNTPRILTVIGHKSVTVVTAVTLQKSSGLCEETIHRAAVGEQLTETTVTRIADAFGRCV